MTEAFRYSARQTLPGAEGGSAGGSESRERQRAEYFVLSQVPVLQITLTVESDGLGSTNELS